MLDSNDIYNITVSIDKKIEQRLEDFKDGTISKDDLYKLKEDIVYSVKEELNDFYDRVKELLGDK